MRRTALALAAAVIVAGCGGDDDGDETTAGGGAPAPAVTVAQTYADPAGKERDVHASLRVAAVHPPASKLPVQLPAGTEASIADVEIVDHGTDPFPLQWTAFSAKTRDGKTLKESLRLSPRRLREGAQLVPVGFAVPEGDALAEVRVRSIVEIWPFDETLPVPA